MIFATQFSNASLKKVFGLNPLQFPFPMVFVFRLPVPIFNVLIQFIKIKSFWSTNFYLEPMKNNRGVELNNSGSLKSTVELGVSTMEYENPLWNSK